MTRPLNPSTSTALEGEFLCPALLVEVALSDQMVRLTSLKRDVVWDGRTFLANGWLLPIQGIEQSTDVGNYGFDLALSGISGALISLILANQDRGERGSIWLAFFNASSVLIGDPILLYRGLIDSCEIEDKLENPSASIKLENDLSRFDTSQNYRFADESHKVYYPDDRGFEYVESLEDWSGFWGRSERPKWLKRNTSTKKNG
jgi:hypothetical protein